MPPLAITLHPSRQLAIVLLLAHAGALAVVFAIVFPVWIKPILLLAIVVSMGLSLRRLHGPQRIVRLKLRNDGLLEYFRRNEETGEARIHPHATVTPWMSILLLRQGRRSEALIVLPDALSSEDFRQLRLWLRWRAEMD